MSVLSRRNRLITVRLTEEEYRNIYAMCVATGSRSVSDLARRAIRQMLDAGKEQSAVTLQGRMDVIEARLGSLAENVSRLMSLIQERH